MHVPAAAVALLACLTALAGCTNGPEDDGFQPSCPAWTRGMGGVVVSGGFHRNFTDVEREDRLATGAAEFDGKPLDKVSLEFYDYAPSGTSSSIDQGLLIRDGRLTLTIFHEDGRQLPIYDLSNHRATRDQWVWEAGNHEDFTLQVDLAEGGEADPATLRAHWLFVRNLDNDPRTPSDASIRYNAGLWYRQC